MNNKAIYALAVAVLVLAGAVLYTAFYEPQGVSRETVKRWETQSGVNARDEDSATPLMKAAGLGQTKAIRRLLKAGADVNAKSNDGWTAFDVWQSGHRHHPDFWRISNLLRP